MSPATMSDAVTENVALLEERRQKRCCFGRYPLYGSDGAWSWLVAFANFLVNFIIVGLGRMSGILYVDFMHIFHVDRKTASIPFSVQQAGRNLFGPLAGILGQKYGLRAVTILGGFIGAFSAFITYFKMDITSITILWGLFFGISTALTTTLNQVSIDQYFEKHRATAGGFAFSGGCVGAFIFPFVLEAIIPHYGMKGTFLVLGAIILIVVPAAMMLVEPPWKRTNASEKTYTRNIKQYGAFEVGEFARSVNVAAKKNVKITEVHTAKQVPYGIDFSILQENSDIVFELLTMKISGENVQTEINQIDSENIDKIHLLSDLECLYSIVANSEIKHENPPLSSVLLDSNVKCTEPIPKKNEDLSIVESDDEIKEDDLSRKEYDKMPGKSYIQKKLNYLCEMRGTRIISRFHYPAQPRACKVLIELRKLNEKLTEDRNFNITNNYKITSNFKIINNEPQHFVSSVPKDHEEPKTDGNNHSNSFYSHIKTAIKLHTNPLFLLVCLCRGVFMLTFIPAVTIIVDFAMDKGLHKSDGKYVIAVLSLGDLLGRLCLGWISDRGYLTLPRYMLIGMLLLGGSTASLPLTHSKISILAAVLFFGILQGSLFVRHPMLISKYMKKHEQSIGMGFINFLSGFLGFALPAFIGYFRDNHGSYDKMFFLNGIICAVVGLLWMLEPFLLRRSSHETSEGRLPDT